MAQGMLGFKSFESALGTLSGIEIVRMIKKEQVSFALYRTLKPSVH
jgi:transposase-like protein